MKVTGQATLHAPAERVWKALNDPAVLARTIPGCERLEEVGDHAYRMILTAGVGSIKGTYRGDVRLTNQRPPSSFVLRASGAGVPGTVQADVKVTLADAGDGSTRLEYDADAVVGGMIGGVGQRVLVGVAKKTAGEFFQAVDDVLTGAARVPAAAPAPGAQAWPAAPAPARAARVGGDFVRGLLLGAALALASAAAGAAIARRSAGSAGSARSGRSRR
jgi:carbon monoxide dehydrogenase subunit G